MKERQRQREQRERRAPERRDERAIELWFVDEHNLRNLETGALKHTQTYAPIGIRQWPFIACLSSAPLCYGYGYGYAAMCSSLSSELWPILDSRANYYIIVSQLSVYGLLSVRASLRLLSSDSRSCSPILRKLREN